jgi:20S proteasome alpha/beta subunit
MTSFMSLSTAVLVCFCLITPIASSSVAPWQAQSARGNVKEEDIYKRMPHTVFSSSGRLYLVEQMVEEASNPEDASSNVAVAITFESGILVVSSATRSPHLDEDVNCTDTEALLVHESPTFQVGPKVYAVTGGNAADSLLLRDKLLQIATVLWERSNGGLGKTSERLPPSVLARHVADQLQRPTQEVSAGKILAVSEQ